MELVNNGVLITPDVPCSVFRSTCFLQLRDIPETCNFVESQLSIIVSGNYLPVDIRAQRVKAFFCC